MVFFRHGALHQFGWQTMLKNGGRGVSRARKGSGVGNLWQKVRKDARVQVEGVCV